MGASYSWGFLSEAFHAFHLAYPRETDIACKVLLIVPGDVVVAWRKDEKNWIRFKYMVHALSKVLRQGTILPPEGELSPESRYEILDMWVRMGHLCHKRAIDIKRRMLSDLGAPIEEVPKLYTAEGPQLLMEFGGSNEKRNCTFQ